jgi:hypothetical protein
MRRAIHTVYGDPFHNVDVFGQHDNRLEVPLDERCLDERTTKIQGFLGTRDGHGRGGGRHIFTGGCNGSWGRGALGTTPGARTLHRTPGAKRKKKKECQRRNQSFYSASFIAHPMELKKDIACALIACETGRSTNDIGLWGSSSTGLLADERCCRSRSSLRGDWHITCPSESVGPIWQR